MWSLKTGGLLTLVNYSEKCTSGGLKARSLQDRFDCMFFTVMRLVHIISALKVCVFVLY